MKHGYGFVMGLAWAMMFSFQCLAQGIETVVQKGHELAVLSVAASPDSSFIVSGSRDKSIKLWDLNTGREVRSFLGHQASITSLAFSSDGKSLISGSNDASMRIWDVFTGQEILLLKPDDERVTDVAYDPMNRFFVTVGFGQKVRVWDSQTKKVMKSLDASGYAGSGGKIYIEVSPNGEYLSVGEDGYTASVYDTKNWSKLHTFNASILHSSCGGCYTDIAFTPDSRYLLKASNNDAVQSYDLRTGKIIHTLKKQVEDLKSLSISKNGRYALLGTEQYITIYNVSKGDSLSTLFFKPGQVANQAIFTMDEDQVVVAFDDNSLIRYSWSKDKKLTTYTGFLNLRDMGGVTYDPNSYWDAAIAKYLRLKGDVLLSRDNQTLLRGKFGTKAKRWDMATGKSVMEYVGHSKAVLVYRYNKMGNVLLTGGADGKLIVWNAETGDTIRTISAYREPIFDVRFSHDESKIVSSSWDATLKIHELATGKLVEYFDLNNSSAYVTSFLPNDLYVLTATLPSGLSLREIDTKKVIREFVGHTETVSSIQVFKDGKKFLSTSWDGSTRLWDIGTGLMEKKLTDHVGAVYASVLPSSELTLFTAGEDRSIREWDLQKGSVSRKFSGHQSAIISVSITSDEKMLISHSVDGVTKFWDLTTGKEFFEHIHFGEKDWMVKNPDGYFNSTENARQFIHFVKGTDTYSANQFFNEFYRPELLPKIFQSRGGMDAKKGMQQTIDKSPPPIIKVAALSTKDGHAEVFVRIQDTGAGVESLKLFHNGKSLTVDRSFIPPKGKGSTVVYKQLVSLVGGNNVFTASVSNKDKVEAESSTSEIFNDSVTKNSTCYLVAVGINQYKNPKLALNYARPDAESFEKLMRQSGALLHKRLEVHTLYDQQATRFNILKKLDELALKIEQEDVFIFYYAGHGSMVDEKFYFIPTESLRLYDASSLAREAIEGQVLQEKLKSIKALKQVIVMDACQSGGSVELLAARGAVDEKAIAQLSRSAGIHVMASAGSEQFAAEFSELGHGLFTYLLIQGLSGQADGSPKDGKVTIYELKSFLDDQVPELTRKLKGKPQYPYTFSRGHDFPLVIDP